MFHITCTFSIYLVIVVKHGVSTDNCGLLKFLFANSQLQDGGSLAHSNQFPAKIEDCMHVVIEEHLTKTGAAFGEINVCEHFIVLLSLDEPVLFVVNVLFLCRAQPSNKP